MTGASGFRVLLIDDDAALARMLSEYLSGYGLAVESAGSAEEGLARVRVGPKPDVVVLDVMLPGLDGFGLLPRLRETEDVPATQPLDDQIAGASATPSGRSPSS